jgi:3D-(3,5/4)-trihydroxycyclohexane-1,2-dione acylhydrolase (decyclizing)
MQTVRLTMAQALVRWLARQSIEIEGARRPLFPGVFAIFGHGNVTCLAEALEAEKETLPTWRGQNEQGMALAAIGFAKAMRRRQVMVAASSIGPGALNMVTAAGVAHSNRLPVLLISGETFSNRRPDPVLQQIERFDDPTVTANDAFRPVTRYWDRITHPEQLLQSLPQATAAMLDPAECGPAFLALPQDVQEWAWDFPAAFFEERLHDIPRPRPDRARLERAAAMVREARRPLIVSGGGVRYSGAEEALAALAERHGVPLVETIAGKGAVVHDHPAHCGPIGVIGSSSANALAEEADLVLAVGTRLQDFTTGSWTAFAPEARFVSINAARWDAVKHRALAVIGDALATLEELGPALEGWKADASWTGRGRELFAEWNAELDRRQAPGNEGPPTYAQVVGVVHGKAEPRDLLVTAAGGLPGEVTKNWRVKTPHSFDCEFGFSCMGYEIPAAWGAALADGSRLPIAMVGDGTYMMMNSDIWSTVLTGKKIVIVVCDNGGYAVIDRLQVGKGGASFNNLIRDCRIERHVPVDFAAHARAMGAEARKVESLSDLAAALDWAKTTDRTTVIAIDTHPHEWTPGDAFWDVGVPEVSERESVREARRGQLEGRRKQRVGT